MAKLEAASSAAALIVGVSLLASSPAQALTATAQPHLSQVSQFTGTAVTPIGYRQDCRCYVNRKYGGNGVYPRPYYGPYPGAYRPSLGYYGYPYTYVVYPFYGYPYYGPPFYDLYARPRVPGGTFVSD